jgi:hypothetical protein
VHFTCRSRSIGDEWVEPLAERHIDRRIRQVEFDYGALQSADWRCASVKTRGHGRRDPGGDIAHDHPRSRTNGSSGDTSRDSGP